MPVDEYFADSVVVTDATTVVDTEALVAAALRLQAAGEGALALQSRVEEARELVLARAASVPAETAWALQTLEEAHGEVSALARACLSLSRALTSAALVYAAAEGDARDFAHVWEQLRPAEAHGWATGMTSLHSGPASVLLPGMGRLTHPVLAPSLLTPGVTWLATAGVVGGQVRHFVDPGRADGTEGLRLQMDAASLARILVGETWSWRLGATDTVEPGTVAWWGKYNTKAPGAASILSAWALGIGRLMRGATTGVEVASSSMLTTRVTRVVDSDPAAATMAGALPPGPFPAAGVTGVAMLVALAPVRQSGGTSGGTRAGSGTTVPGRATTTPRGASQLLSRISALSSSDTNGQVEVLRHTTPLDGGAQRTSWSVVIRGTQRWDAGGANPQDLLTNLQGVAGEESDQVRAVRTAMEMAGIQEGDTIEFTGHSQGGIIAAQMAADPQVAGVYHVAAVLTAGAPTAGASVGAGVDMLNLENTGDPVPALDGSANTDRGNSTTVHFDGRHVLTGGEGAALGPHDLGIYREAVGWMEQEGEGRPEEVSRWVARRASALGLTEGTTTTSQLFDTRRVGPE